MKSHLTHDIFLMEYPKNSFCLPYSLTSTCMILPYTNVNIKSYADDLAITSTYNDIPTATTQLQSYLNTLQTWFNTNWLKVAPTKSTITLLTNYPKEHQHTPQLPLDNIAIPQKHSTEILGVTYNTSLGFKDHMHAIKQKCTHRLNTLPTRTGTDFRQHKEALILI